MGRAGGAGEIRLPRPQDPDRAADRGRAGEPARHRDRSHRASRSTTRKPTTCWRARKRSACSNWKARACGARCSTCGPTASRTSSRWSRSTAPVRWRTSRPIARASTSMEKPDYIHPKLEPILKETFGVIVYQEQVMQAAQILAGYTLGQADLLRRAMGKKIRKEMQAQRTHLRRGRDRARHRALPGRRHLRPARALRRIRLQQEPRRGLRAGRLPDRLHEGELPGRVPGGVDDARHGQYRQARRIPRRGRTPRHQGRAAVDQPLAASPSRSTATPSSTRWPRSKASAARRSKRSSRRAANGKFADLADFADRINPRAVNKRVLESLAAAGAFDAFEPTARASSPRSTPCSARAQRAHEAAAVGQNELFGGGGARERSRCRRPSPGCRPSGCGANTRRSASSSPAIRSTTTPPCSRNCACSPGPISRAR